MKILFKNPVKSDILVFDENNYKYLKEVLPSWCSITIIKQRPQEFFISKKIIKQLANIFFKKFSLKGGIKKNLKGSYYEALILSLQPRAVVTLIDNNQTFNYLSKTIKSIPFIAIQNGLRHSFEGNAYNYHVQHFFSFGQNEKKHFPKYNMEVVNYYPAGSLISSIFSKDNIENIDEKFDILIVSCWRGNIGYGKDVQDSMNSMKIANNLMSKYLSKRDLKAAIVLRSERDGEHWYMPEIGMNEEEYFKKQYPQKVEIIDFDSKSNNIYKLIKTSSLLISAFGTTVLLEGYGNEKKILYTIFCDDEIYHEMFDNSILLLNPEWKDFESKLDEIIAIDEKKYIKHHKKNMGYYMNKPKPNTVGFIKKKIDEIISYQLKN